MFDDLNSGGWLIVVVALIFGFGIVRWVISAAEDKFTGSPKSPGTQSNQSKYNHAEESSSRQQSKESAWQESQRSNSTARAWHEVLGIVPAASIDEIRSAYKLKMSQYHPDKVASLGEEFTDIAVNKSKEINLAYKQAMAIRSGLSE